MLKVEPSRRRHGIPEVITGHRLAIVPLEIEIHPAPEALGAQQGVIHADHLGPLVIDRGCIEIIHRDIGIWADGVGHRPGIFGKLGRAQNLDIFDSGHRLRCHIGAELLVSENREPFFQGQLKPIATGHAVPRPVVKILVPDDALDSFIVGVRRGIGQRQHVFRVEYVEALVLHRPHIEIVDGHNHVDIKIVFEAKNFFVPRHGALEGRQSVLTLLDILGLDPNFQQHLTATSGGKGAPMRAQVPRH